MSIKTDITQEDYGAFVKHLARTLSTPSGDKVLRRLILFTVGLGIGLAVTVHHMWPPRTTVAAMLCGALAGAFLMMVFIANMSRRQMRRMSPADDGFVVGSQEVFVEDDGIRQRSRHHQSVFGWSLIRDVTVTEKHVFLMIDRMAGIIVPRCAFASDAEREQFVSEIERHSGKVRT